jgi:hypothetical protein
LPNLAGAPEIPSADVPIRLPRAGILADTRLLPFDNASVRGRSLATGEFVAEASYGVGSERGIQVMSWTPTGQIQLLLPLQSPVTKVEVTTLDGHEAVLISPVTGVQGNPPVRIYVFNRGVAYYFEADGFSEPREVIRIAVEVVRGADK